MLTRYSFLYSIIIVFLSSILIGCNSGGGTGNQSTPTPMVVTHAYFTNADNSITQCVVDESGIESVSCVDKTPQGNGALSAPQGMAIKNSIAYIVNFGNNSYTQCNIDPETGLDIYSCQTTDLQFLNNPTSVTIDQSYLYFTNGGGNLTQCAITGDGVVLSSCANVFSGLPSPVGITISNGFAYIANLSQPVLTQCVLTTNGELLPSTCNSTTSYINTAGPVVYNNYIYSPSPIPPNYNSYSQCILHNGVTDETTCQEYTPTGSGTLSSPMGLAIYNNIAYFANHDNNTYTQCNVNSAGIDFTSCKTTKPSLNVGSGSVDLLYYPNSVTIG